MAKYDMIELPQMNGTEKKILYPRLQHTRLIEGDEFVHQLAELYAGVTSGMALSIYAATSELLARLMSEGYSVRLKGIGTFHATLGMKKDKDFETDEDKHNARSIEVNDIKFVADKQLVRDTDRCCTLERGVVKKIKRIKTTKEERLNKLLKYLESHANITVSEYAYLTGLSVSTATKEIRQFSETENSGVKARGRAPHKEYVRG